MIVMFENLNSILESMSNYRSGPQLNRISLKILTAKDITSSNEETMFSKFVRNSESFALEIF